MNVYREILKLLDEWDVSESVIYEIFGLLDDYTCNSIHNEIFDLLYEFLISKNEALLGNIRQICINNVGN